MENTTLAERLRELRKAAELTQQQLADAAHVKQSFIGALESGEQKTSSWLPEIAKALNVDCYWLKTGIGIARPWERSHQQKTAEPTPPAYSSIQPARIQQLLKIASKMDDSGLDKLIGMATVLAETHPKRIDKNRVA